MIKLDIYRISKIVAALFALRTKFKERDTNMYLEVARDLAFDFEIILYKKDAFCGLTPNIDLMNEFVGILKFDPDNEQTRKKLSHLAESLHLEFFNPFMDDNRAYLLTDEEISILSEKK